MAKSKNQTVRRTGNALATLWAIIAWLTGLLVALAVGFGMVSGTLGIPGIPTFITATAGWVVVVLVILGAILALIDKLSR